jgi:asparagine synthase (glutamine-hydrolysing)
MCGILGHIPFCKKALFEKSLETLKHRGPDGSGIWNDEHKRITLGHRRLSIIDLSENGRQPMEWGERYVITFNGEIYNYIELRKELEDKGIQFRTQTDTEVLLALYTLEGSKCLEKLNGMWAFAIYDKQENSLFLSRDRMGEKPLFYMQKGEVFAFASEMKALYKFIGNIEPDSEIIEKAKANMFSYEATEDCLVKGIKRFPAASFGIYKNGDLTIHNYWNVLDHLVKVPNRYEEQVEMFRELFIDSCKIRMRSDVPIGTALSGGIDSSATISTMSQIARNQEGQFSRDWQHAFVASFPGSFLDETKEAKRVADNLNIKATFLDIDPLKDIDNIFFYSYLFEEFYITSPLPFIQLYRQIKNCGTTVTLDGHGSDELFGGYGNDISQKVFDDYPNPFKIKETLQTVSDIQINGLRISPGRTYLELKNLAHKRFTSNKREGAKKKAGQLDYLNSRLHQSSFENILPTLLRNYDRYSMINGIEIRMPFLDHQIVSFAFSIPGSSKVKNGYSKAIVRDAMKGFFPDDIRLLKRKIGFNSPFTEWMKGPLKEWLIDQMESESFRSASFINPEKIKESVISVIKNPAATATDGAEAWMSLMPFVWEKSLEYAK